MNTIKEYKEYAGKIGNRKEIYQAVQVAYNIKSALYPGSHIDISPSLVIPEVTYIDNFKGAIRFFKEDGVIKEYIEKNKSYKEKSLVKFLGEDYKKASLEGKYDLIISQYAGFVGQDTKQFLKEGGYLLCNDSHGDATLAYCDSDYKFVGVVTQKNTIDSNNLDKYFKLKKNKSVDIERVLKYMKGPQYTVNNENYIFRLKTY